MKTALLVIDVQMALAADDANGAERSCPQAEQNITSLLETFRNRKDMIVHIHHHGLDADDPFNANASDLGFDTVYVSDAVWAYAVTGPDGVDHSAEQVHSTSLSTIQGEFASVLTTENALAL